MEILVNQEPLSFALESEKVLGEVIDGIARWLGEDSYAITSIDVDDKSLPIHDRSAWQDLTVETVTRLSVEAFPVSYVEQTTLAALAEYCVLLDRALDEGNTGAVGDLANELPYVRRRLKQFFPGLSASDPSESILTDDALDRGEMPHTEARVRIASQLHSIGTILESRMREFENPLRELSITLGQLLACSGPLVEVPVQLHTGEERDAMSTIVRFAELLSRMIRLVPMTDDAPDLDLEALGRLAVELTPFLQQLLEAFEVQDSVLIGDLLEYEVAPRLERIPTLLPDEWNVTGEPAES